MIDSSMAAQDPRKLWLIVVTLCFVIAGISLSWFSFESALLGDRCLINGKVVANGSIIDGYKTGKVCVCSDARVLCEDQAAVDFDSDLSSDDFSRDNLNFEARYITSGISQELSQAPLSTVFKSIHTQDKSLEVVLEQAQLCTDTMQAPVQIGLYHASKKALTLTLVVNSVASVYIQPCTVETTFTLTDFKYKPGNDYALQYQSEDGQLVRANACVYNNKLFNDEDRYEAIDGCNICRCENGISKCTNDKVCE